MYGFAPYIPSTTQNANYDSRTVANYTSLTTTYVSPISADDNCSANYVFLLTDGEPNWDGGVKANTEAVTGDVCSIVTTDPSKQTAGNTTANWECKNGYIPAP